MNNNTNDHQVRVAVSMEPDTACQQAHAGKLAHDEAVVGAGRLTPNSSDP